MADHVVITGVPRPPGPASTPPPRREINDLVNDNRQFSLFIQALQAMYETPQNQGLSHFQIAGVHGMPYVRWELSGPDAPVGRWPGYCSHGTVIFPTWHRPYVATYEQILQGHAVRIASTYNTPDAEQWRQAANDLRLPYWDWAVKVVPPSQVISDAQVTITRADGQQVPVNNPLVAYPFNPNDPNWPAGFGDPYSDWPTTMRHAIQTSTGWTSDVDELLSDLQSEGRNIRTSTYNLLTRINSWPAFSNHTPGDGGSTTSSLEAIHDLVHGLVGGYGHMSDTAVAGFDPIFFLHHCNVDRLLALWGALHPNTWVTPGRANGGTWTMRGTATANAESDLTPFWNGTQTYWSSDGCRQFETPLNYTYPEFAGLSGQDPNVIRARIGAIVNRLYGGGARRTFAFAAAGAEGATGQSMAPAAEKILTAAEHTAPAPPAAMQFFAAPAVAAPAAPQPDVGAAGLHKYYDWSARVHGKIFELGGSSYCVLIFLGPVPDDPKQWRTSSSYVGCHQVFANSKRDLCENCRRDETENVEGFVSLNGAIAAHSGLNSYSADVVEPYLKKELSWRVQKVDRTVVGFDQVPSLQVEVVALPMHLDEGEMFPKIGTPVHYHDITLGQPGGRQSA